MRLVAEVFLKAKRFGRRIFSRVNCELTPEQLWVLIMISDNNVLNIKELADSYHRENTTVTRMIDGLERRNLVLRVPDQNDHRRKRICLTHAGRTCVEETRALFHQFFRRTVEGIDGKDLEVTKIVLHKVLRNFEEVGKILER